MLVDKPDLDTRCPASGAKLRFKDLTVLKFTRPPPGEEGSCYAVDPVTNDALTNAHALVALKPTGVPTTGPLRQALATAGVHPLAGWPVSWMPACRGCYEAGQLREVRQARGLVERCQDTRKVGRLATRALCSLSSPPC